MGHVVHSTTSTRETLCTIFMLGWARCCFHKKCARTHYAELVFLHPVGTAGQVVVSSVFGPRNIDGLFFMLRWDHYGFDKKCTVTRYDEFLFLHTVRSTGHVVHSATSGA
jgi:hypothetical protein